MNVLKTIDCLSSQICNKIDLPCDICQFAKQSRLPFAVSNTKASECFELIHCDLWGPYKSPTYSTCHSFLTIVEDFNRCTWTYLLSSKT